MNVTNLYRGTTIALTAAVAVTAAMLVHPAPVHAAEAAAASKAAPTTIVLVHGAFADGSGWNKVIPTLQKQGYKVVAVQNPLTSLADDVAATRRVIEAQQGEVVLVGHSWGGVVITEAGNDPKVKSLVYVAAFAPEAGQSVADASRSYAPAPGLKKLVADSGGFLTLTPADFRTYFAPDVAPAEANLMAVAQGPVQSKVFEEKVGAAAAWQHKPSWFVVATNDQMIPPVQQSDDAKKIGATVIKVATSHVPMVSQPNAVAKAILAAAR